ncbi:MAG: hypothetical protein ACXWUS_09635 [Burkholderiales bacterium]
MDILFFIGQALAIAGIGYVVSQAFVYAAKYGDPITWKSADFPTPAVPAPADAQMEDMAVHFSFVPESVGGAEDLAAQASEESLSLRKAA